MLFCDRRRNNLGCPLDSLNYLVCLFALSALLFYGSIQYGYGRHVYDILYGAFNIEDVYGFLQSQLYGAYASRYSCLSQHPVGNVGRADVGKDQGIHLFVLKSGERIFLFTEFAVEVYLHLSIYKNVGIVAMEYFYGTVYGLRSGAFFRAEIRAGEHGDHGIVGKKAYGKTKERQ